MPRFKVEIHGEGLERAMVALHGADIPTLGPHIVLPRPGEEPSPEQLRVSGQMWAVLDADTAEAAEDRVSDMLPADGDYTVESARPWQRG